MKKRAIAYVMAVLGAVLVAVLVVIATAHFSRVITFRKALVFPLDAVVTVELWHGEKSNIQVTDSDAILSALKKSDYMKEEDIDVVAPDQEVYVLTVLTDNRMEKFTILAQDGTGYWANENPVLFRCKELVTVLRNMSTAK